MPARETFPERFVIRANLRASFRDGWLYMVMVGLAETFFPLFVLALHQDRVSSGLVLTAPMLLAAVLQLAAQHLARLVGSYRKFIVMCAVVQAAACPLLAGVALAGAFGQQPPVWVTFAIATMYYAGMMVGSPIWMHWIALLVPTRVRARVFAVRNRVLQGGVILGVLAGAVALDALPGKLTAWVEGFTKEQAVLVVFAMLFVAAGVCRALSALYLYRHTDPPMQPSDERVRPLHAVVLSMHRAREGRVILVLVLVQAAIFVGSPFWNAFVRESVGVSFLQFAALICLGFAGKALGLGWLGGLARRHGARWLLLRGVLAMAPVPAVWAMTDNLWLLAVAALLGGIAAAGLELASFLILVERLPEKDRTGLLMVYHVLQAGGSLAGSSAGGAALRGMGEDRAAFTAIFVASALARLACVPAVALLERHATKSKAEDVEEAARV